MEAQEERRRAADELQSVQARAAVHARRTVAQKHEADMPVMQLSLREMMCREAEAAGSEAGDAREEEGELQRRLGRKVARLSACGASIHGAVGGPGALQRSICGREAGRAPAVALGGLEAPCRVGSRCRQRPLLPGRQHRSHAVRYVGARHKAFGSG